MDDILAELPTLVRLARTGSVTRTARELGVPRSTISRRLARLEAAMGVTLAERTTRSFRLTEEGQQLAAGATKVLAELTTLRERVEQAAGSVRGWLRVCTPPGLGGPLLGRFLAVLYERHPDLRVELTVREHLPHLLDEPFDVVFALGALDDAPWVRHRVGQIWYLLVAHPDYLAARGRPSRVEDLAEHTLLAVRSGGMSGDRWPTLAGGELDLRPHLVSSDLGAVASAASAGIGIALLPVHLAAEGLASGRLEAVLAGDVGLMLDIVLLYPAERRDSPLIRALLESVDAFGELLADELPSRP